MDLILLKPPVNKLKFWEPFSGVAIDTSRWTVTDTESKITVSGGNLAFAGGRATPGWSDPGIESVRSFARRAGLTMEWEYHPAAFGHHVMGFAKNPGALDGFEGFRNGDTEILRVHLNGTEVNVPFILVSGNILRMRVVLKTAGALYYLSNDSGATWKLVWDNTTLTLDPIKATLWVYRDAMTNDYVKVFQGTVKAPIVSDTFTRADSTTTLGSAETGQAYTVVSGTWGISSNKAYSVSDANNEIVVLSGALPGGDGLVEATMSGALNAAGGNYRLPQLLFRYLDANNFLLIDNANNNTRLFKNDGGVYTQLSGTANNVADGVDHTARVVCNGNAIGIYMDGAWKNTITLTGGDTKYAAYTQVGIRWAIGGTPATAARFDALKVEGGIG